MQEAINHAKLAMLFRKEFELCNVRKGETIVLLSDLGARRDYVSAAFAAAEDFAADAYEMCVNAMPMHSSSLETRMSLKEGSRAIGRNSPPLVTISGTERMNSTALALSAAMMLEPFSSISSSSCASKSASIGRVPMRGISAVT